MTKKRPQDHASDLAAPAPVCTDTELDAMKQVVQLQQENAGLKRTIGALETTIRVLKALQ